MAQNMINCFKKCTACNSLKANCNRSPTCVLLKPAAILTLPLNRAKQGNRHYDLSFAQ